MHAATTREAIVAAADDLFYRQGYASTAFADIAAAVGISRGNFYYHFKAKDDILAAVIERRLAATRAMLARWEDESPEPAERICAFIRIIIANRAKIMLHGCPVGTLCTELAKLEHDALVDAARLFALFRDWLAGQFEALGVEDPLQRAMHVLGLSQGVATVAMTFRDEDYVRREVDRLCAWVRRGAPADEEACSRCT